MDETFTSSSDDRLYEISVIPTAVTFAVITAYYSFIHLSQLPVGSSLMLDLIINLYLPLLLAFPIAFFLSYEILATLTNADNRNSGSFHAKRFLGRLAIVIVSGLSFIVVYVAFYFLLAQTITERLALLSSLFIWLAVLGFVVSRFRTILARLEKGEWQQNKSDIHSATV